jgi:IclR family acetate operon transcriptional repressor
LGSVYIQSLALESIAHPFLKALAETCGQSANLGILDRGEVVHLTVVPSDRPIHFSVRNGQRDAAHSSGLGKVLLSALSDEELDAVITAYGLPARTPNTISTPAALAQGYAIDTEESVPGLSCIAAPVIDDRGQVRAAVSISGLTSEFAEPNRSAYVEAVRQAAHGISVRLGAAVRNEEGSGLSINDAA